LLGYTGSYDRVAAFARLWKRGYGVDTQAFVPLQFSPGEAFQFDWSEDYVVIAGLNTKLQVAHKKLSFRRAFMVRAYFLQTHEMLFDVTITAYPHWVVRPNTASGGTGNRRIIKKNKDTLPKSLLLTA
jgi:hypothetical protein